MCKRSPRPLPLAPYRQPVMRPGTDIPMPVLLHAHTNRHASLAPPPHGHTVEQAQSSLVSITGMSTTSPAHPPAFSLTIQAHPNLGRISCAQNALFRWNKEMFVAEVHMLWPIAWREVTMCYVPKLERHKAGQAWLLDAYGFTCACELCARVHSDALRAQLEGLTAHSDELPNMHIWAWARDRCTSRCARAAGHLHHTTRTLPFHSAG